MKWRRYLAAPILNILVPQTGHFPSVAGLPFFIVICTASLISRLVLHFTQYASAAIVLHFSGRRLGRPGLGGGRDLPSHIP